MELRHYVVEPGDTLWGIAQQYEVNVEAIRQANSWIENIDLIQPGWVFHIPVPEPEPDPDILLPPPGKAWIGTSVPSGALDRFTSITGRDPHIWHEYSISGDGFASDLDRCPDNMIPLINCKPLGKGTMSATGYQRVVNGEADGELDKVAAAIIAYGRYLDPAGAIGKPLFVAFMHEPENDDKTGASDAVYAAAFRHCVEYVRAKGASFVSVWNMMGYTPNWYSRYDTLYPGDDVVDWFGTDPYTTTTATDSFADFVNRSGSNYEGFYDWCSATAPNKPVMLCEWGIGGTAMPTVAPKILTAAEMAVVKSTMPNIKAFVYWDQLGSQGDYRTNQMPDDYARWANLEVFDH